MLMPWNPSITRMLAALIGLAVAMPLAAFVMARVRRRRRRCREMRWQQRLAARRARRQHTAARHRDNLATLLNPDPERRPTVLLVAPEAVAISTRRLLDGSGCRTIVTTDVTDAWALVQARRPDLVILDDRAAGLPVLQWLDLLLRDLVLADLPVIVQTTSLRPQECLARGAAGAVEEGARDAALLDQVGWVLRGPR